MHRAPVLLALVAVLASGCSEDSPDPGPPIPASILTGSYSVALTSTSDLNYHNSCPNLTVHVAAGGVVTWGPVGCFDPYGGAITGGGDSLRLFDSVSVGGPPVQGKLYDFGDFRGTAEEATAGWLGPCTQAIGGGGLGCYRESGASEWSKVGP